MARAGRMAARSVGKVAAACSSYPEVHDREGFRIHPGARVRVERESSVVPGRIERFGGDVTAIVTGERRGVPAVLVHVHVQGQSHARTVLPSHCRVIRRSATASTRRG